MSLLALIPAFNESKRIADVVRGARLRVDEVLVIDDGSRDETAKIAAESGARVIQHDQNRGKGAALITGFADFLEKKAHEWLIVLDADGQHDPDEIPKFLDEAQKSGAKIVVGTRMLHTERMPFVRHWTNRMTSWLISRAAKQKIPDSQCGFRLLHRSAIEKLRLETAHFETESEMLIQAGRAGVKISSVPIRTIYDLGRASRIRPLRDTVRFFKLIARYGL
jgi:glycosyltransferase involved in cell wall biosynthesis